MVLRYFFFSLQIRCTLTYFSELLGQWAQASILPGVCASETFDRLTQGIFWEENNSKDLIKGYLKKAKEITQPISKPHAGNEWVLQCLGHFSAIKM